MVGITNAKNVADLLRDHSRRLPDREALRYLTDSGAVAAAGQPLTYSELDRAVTAVAARLSRDFKAGDRFLLLYPGGPDFIIAFLACQYAGMVAVPAPLPGDRRHERRRVLSIAASSGSVAVLTDEASANGIAEWLREHELTDVQLLSTDRITDDPGDFSPPDELTHGTLAMLQYTSGSTGEPKGVMVSHGNLLCNVETMGVRFGFDEHTNFGGWIPHFHDMGLIAQLLLALFHGGRCVVMAPVAFVRRPFQWLKMIDEFDIEWSAAPNFAYELCCRRITDEQLAELDLSRWRYAVNGSEPIHATTLTAFTERFRAAGFRADAPTPCYGLAESTVFVSGEPAGPRITEVDVEMLEDHKIVEASPGRQRRGLVSCGRPTDTDVQIVDPETGNQLPASAVGEIWLRGESVASGYWKHPEATAETFGAEVEGLDGRYLRTGDLGTLHDDELYVTGRIKEMINVHGRNLYPQDVEYELRAAHPELVGGVGAVFSVADGPDASLVVTHEVKVQLAEDELRLLAQRMKQTVARELGVTASAVVLLRAGTVRRTTSGKIQRDAMRALFENGGLNSVHVQDARQ